MEEDGTQKISDVVGTYLLSEILKLRDEFQVVGDVRGKGLMLGMELVADKVRHSRCSERKADWCMYC